MASENIEQLFCKEYETLKTENTNLKNHNQQLKNDLDSINDTLKIILENIEPTKKMLDKFSLRDLEIYYNFARKNNVYQTEKLNIIFEALSERKRG